VCRKPFGKNFAFHHRKYISGEPYWKNYRDSTSYQLAVLPFIKRNPKQFYLFCKPHHYFVEWGKKIKDKDMWRRYLNAVRMSQ